MKLLPLLIGVIAMTQLQAHPGKINSLSFSYFGEMLTHPGFKLNAGFPLKTWKGNNPKVIQKSIILSTGIGFFYHKRYQTGLFFIPEISYQRHQKKGKFIEMGAGLGYLKTLIPNSFEVHDSEIRQVTASHSYLSSNVFLVFGKGLRSIKKKQASYFVKPQLLLAAPGFPSVTGYFALELGIKQHL
ncbi:hypothetical protein [Jiulongibacter sediminis]|uniref:Outer membrane protein beta-barrel domain-containing protein n=1 Tax=Jiulongibacter sediminis TaxID=1605367 RepID=A0A0P7BT38_9BACT|nr:hypothetical protein [Jiulongibacter sediminis]KPM47661.1 hypothetical protein AFM12_14400 [Jiulongibacter sediminis]TBX23453.1 hypothetical protein TK44_14410 [Jiulongibacter sediminis]